MATWATVLNKNFLSLHGRKLGLFQGFISAGAVQDDTMLGGYGFHGILQSVSDGLTAHSGGGQTNALKLTAMINRVTTVGAAADSVRLPPSQPGMTVTVINDAAVNSMTVYGDGTDTIDGVATGTGNALAAAHRGVYVCYAAGTWVSYGSAKAA